MYDTENIACFLCTLLASNDRGSMVFKTLDGPCFEPCGTLLGLVFEPWTSAPRLAGKLEKHRGDHTYFLWNWKIIISGKFGKAQGGPHRLFSTSHVSRIDLNLF